MPLAALPSILAVADASAISANNPIFAYAVGAVVLGGIVTAVTVADRVDSMIQRRRRQPSVDVDLKALETSISTLTTTVDALVKAKDDHTGHKERIIALEARAAELKAQLEREIATQRSYVAKTSKEIFQRIDDVQSTVANNFKEVERGLGKVEGSLDQFSERVAEAVRAAAAAQTAAAQAAAQAAAANR